MKKILLIATGGTIASRHTEKGLSPQISGEELLGYIPEAKDFSRIDVIQPFSLDSTNVHYRQWLILAGLIREHYESYDGFVICHGTDTMAYTAAALSYLVQHSNKPIVITGAQRPIDLPDTDARTNLTDSVRFAADDRSHDVCIVFGGMVIAGTRAKKERTKSYDAFSSINYPPIAVIQDRRIIFYIDDKGQNKAPIRFYDRINSKVFLYRMIPGSDGNILDTLMDRYDALIIESFGVGGIPDYGDDSFREAIRKWTTAGKEVVMATQVPNEGSDMSVYEVGHAVKNAYNIPESYDMTLEAVIAKTMWILGETQDRAEFRKLFYTSVNHDLLFIPDV
ncbi:MAG: asparaginase [Blautia sp.]|nr:asparaginase [Blautia sp.]